MKVRVLGCSGAISKGCRTTSFLIDSDMLDVAMLVIETAFSNREQVLTRQSLHLSPCVLAEELDCIAQEKKFSVHITPTKPADTEVIMSEIQRFDQNPAARSGVAHDIRWLRAGQEFEV